MGPQYLCHLSVGGLYGGYWWGFGPFGTFPGACGRMLITAHKNKIRLQGETITDKCLQPGGKGHHCSSPSVSPDDTHVVCGVSAVKGVEAVIFGGD